MTGGLFARSLFVSLVACYAAAGVLAAHRAYFPVSRVTIRAAKPALQAGTVVRVDTVTSGRGPVSIRVELVQDGRVQLVVLDSIASKRWAYWDPRRVIHSTHATMPRWLPARFRAGEITLRATVTGAPAWLRQPPPVVEEVRLPLQIGGSVGRPE